MIITIEKNQNKWQINGKPYFKGSYLERFALNEFFKNHKKENQS